MHILSFTDRLFWLAEREGKITGTRSGNLVGAAPTVAMISDVLKERGVEVPKSAKKGDVEKLLKSEDKDKLLKRVSKKLGYYELIAERLGVPADDEFPMERGTRLEKDAIELFVKETGKDVDATLVMWEREDQPAIAVSPDAFVKPTGNSAKVTEAIEVKCLKSSLHIKAFIENHIPEEYWDQALQYFVVNDDLETLHFILYDPRFDMFGGNKNRKVVLDYLVFDIQRSDVEEEITRKLEIQKFVLAGVDEFVNALTF
jgi:YqaJ-like viral recombinase domain